MVKRFNIIRFTPLCQVVADKIGANVPRYVICSARHRYITLQIGLQMGERGMVLNTIHTDTSA